MPFDPTTTCILDRLLEKDQCSRSPAWRELLKATARGLEATTTINSVTNLQVRQSVHGELRRWATTSVDANAFRFRHFVPALCDGVVGSFSRLERGESDLLLVVTPIGVVYRDDPGRAFHLSAEVAATVDADPRTFLSAGAIGTISALLSSGVGSLEALSDTARFIRPFDWSGEIALLLSGEMGRSRGSASGCSPLELLATAVNSLLDTDCSDADGGRLVADDELSAQLVAVQSKEPKAVKVTSGDTWETH